MMSHATTIFTRVRNYLRSDMRILRWVFLTFYLIIILGLTLPAFFSSSSDTELLLILLGVFFVSQAMFILGAGTVNLCYPIQRRRLWMPAIAAGFMFTVLAASFYLAFAELVYLDRYVQDNLIGSMFLLIIAVSWIGWGVAIWIRARDTNRYSLLARITKLLFAGSLAELLAAVPSHMIVSKRPGCLVGLGTMLGIVAGIYVMLFAFGPAVVLLFLRPRYRKEAMETSTCTRCFYNLTGTLAANRNTCPECGEPIAYQ